MHIISDTIHNSSILISGIAFYSAFSYASGDIFLALNLAFGQFAVFAGQIVQKVRSNPPKPTESPPFSLHMQK